ncbi:hypothetical protein TRVA0_024S00474 [Trichomonascus vanleenenianus]|uniref:uncharacterized protein n=1 Tax=Trichomonascus vanleenenianus TaxID=2268995 RepID=UPI003EC9F2DE
MKWTLFVLLLPSAVFAAATGGPKPTEPTQSGKPTPVAQNQPTAIIQGNQVIYGRYEKPGYESFKGIPFAEPPAGLNRLKRPVRSNRNLDGFQALNFGHSCPSMDLMKEIWRVLSTIPIIKDVHLPMFNTTNPQMTSDSPDEDCLTLNVFRPKGTTDQSKLPIMLWIYGGGFEAGSSSGTDPTRILEESANLGMPIMFVTINYRIAGYGFMAGKELAQDNSTNLGLLDQRLALEWVADNIANFGGDPDKVTIAGESAGSMSVAHHMYMYDGDHTYKGKPLFRGAIMLSGSAVPSLPVDSAPAQDVFNRVVNSANCTNAPDKLECLRALPAAKFDEAQNSVPSMVSHSSLALSYCPRPGDKAFSELSFDLITEGKMAKVPFIIGDLEDEGTCFAVASLNVTSEATFNSYLQGLMTHLSSQTMKVVDQLYPSNAADGSPFRTGPANALTGQFKRMAALLGDIAFQWPRRLMLEHAPPHLPVYSYIGTHGYGNPILGSNHGADLPFLFDRDDINSASRAYRRYFIAFVVTQNPNINSTLLPWPPYSSDRNIMEIGLFGNYIEKDTARLNQSQFINSHIHEFLI